MFIVVEGTVDGTVRRALVPAESLPYHEARGWVGIGPCSEPGREPLESDGELAERAAAEAKALAALLAKDAKRGRA